MADETPKTPPKEDSWEQLTGTSGRKRCALCVNSSTVSFTAIVQRKPEPGEKGKGKSVANKTISLCEPCAKTVFKGVLALTNPE